jgi:flagellar biosynthesis/type III secretory pathway protein FliH
MSFLLIDLTKFAAEINFEQLSDEVQKWCYVIKNMWRMKEGDIPAGETVFRELFENCKISKLNAMEKQEYEKSVLEYEDVKDAMEYHHRMGKAEGFNEGYEKGMEKGIERGEKKGIEKGIEKGLEEGIKKGIEEGMERGIKKGQEDAKRQLVASMIEHGMPIADIAGITGLTEDEVRQLCSER